MDDIKAKLRKILALTSSTIKGERESAQAMLHALLTKHNLTVEDICDETLHRFKFYYTSKLERILILQLAGLNDPESGYWHRKGTRCIILKLSKVVGLDMQYKYNIYRKALKAHVDDIFHAFLIKNDLLTQASDNAPELTPAEWAAIKRAYEQARNLTATRVNQAIDFKDV